MTIIYGRGEGVTIDFGHANPNAKYRVNMSAFGWFPDEVHLEGYDDEDPNEEDGQRQDAIRNREDDGSDSSELSELTDEE